MYRFPDPLDEDALKPLVADERYADSAHPEYPFYRKFVDRAFALVYPDPPRDGAGNFVIDPRDPPKPQVITGGAEFRPWENDDKRDTARASSSSSWQASPLLAQPGVRTAENQAAFGLGNGDENDDQLSKNWLQDPTSSSPFTVESAAEQLAQQTSSNASIADLEDAKGGLESLYEPVGDLHWPVAGRQMRSDSQGAGQFGLGLRTGGRDHEGVDIVAKPGEAVTSPFKGTVLRTFQVYDNDPSMRGVIIVGDDGRVARVMYVQADARIQPGMRVDRGEVIGTVQDIAGYHAATSPGMTNHVHFEVWLPNDRRSTGPKKDFDKNERHQEYTARDPWPWLQKSK